MVKNKFDEDYDVNVKSFQFDTFRRNDPSIAIEFQRLLPQRWAVYKEATYQQVKLGKKQIYSTTAGWSFQVQVWLMRHDLMTTITYSCSFITIHNICDNLLISVRE